MSTENCGTAQHLEELESGDKQTVNGVKKACVLHKHLSHFHPVTGFPPDILHNVFKVVIPVELCLCLKDLVRKGFITFDGLNSRIKLFPYKHSDKVNKPKQITKASFGKKRISGNGHENWTLLRLLPLLIRSSIPEKEPSWEILMDLKEIVEIVVLIYQRKYCVIWRLKYMTIACCFLTLFLTSSVVPKHHYIEHYVHLIRCFGRGLVDHALRVQTQLL